MAKNDTKTESRDAGDSTGENPLNAVTGDDILAALSVDPEDVKEPLEGGEKNAGADDDKGANDTPGDEDRTEPAETKKRTRKKPAPKPAREKPREQDEEPEGQDDAAADKGDDDAAADKGDDDDAADKGDDDDDKEPADEAEADDEGDEAEADDGDGEKAETDDDQEREAEADEEDTFPAGTPKWAKGQIRKLRKRAREAESEVAEIRQRTEASVASGGNQLVRDLLSVREESDITKLEEKYDERHDSAEDTLEKMARDDWDERDSEGRPVLTVGEGEKARIYTRDDLRGVMRNAKAALRQIPKVRAFLQYKQDIATKARKAYPWLKDAKHPHRKDFDRVMAALPGLRTVVDADFLVADAVIGRSVREAQARARERGGRERERERPRAGTHDAKEGARDGRREREPDREARDGALRALEEDGSEASLTKYVDNLVNPKARR